MEEAKNSLRKGRNERRKDRDLFGRVRCKQLRLPICAMEAPTDVLSMMSAYILLHVTSAAWKVQLAQILGEAAGSEGLTVAEVARRLAKNSNPKAANGKQITETEGGDMDQDVEEFEGKKNNSYREAAVGRILRFLAAYGLVEQNVNGSGGEVTYSLAAGIRSTADDEFEDEDLDPSAPPSLDLVSTSNSILLHPYMDSKWTNLPDLLAGRSIPPNHDEQSFFFSIFNSDPAVRRSFNVAMAFFSTSYMRSFCGSKNSKSSYDLDPNLEARTLVDVGGADGRLAARISRRYPHLSRVLNFDLPPVIALAPHRPGVENVEGNMLQHVPSGDIILLSNVLHNWADEDCIKTLQNCHKSLTGYKKLIILEVVIENTISEELSISSARGKLALDIQMMILTNNRGKERTRNHWDKILKAARFENYKIVALDGSSHSVIEASID